MSKQIKIGEFSCTVVRRVLGFERTGNGAAMPNDFFDPPDPDSSFEELRAYATRLQEHCDDPLMREKIEAIMRGERVDH